MAHDSLQWIQDRAHDLLPVPYFHVVFSFPDYLHSIIRAHRRIVYPIAMRAAALALQEVAAKQLGGRVAVMSTLHTAARTLAFHPHVHCLVTAGALTVDGHWRTARSATLACKTTLARAFRTRFYQLIARIGVGLPRTPRRSASAWQVFVERPPHGTQAILRYLSKSLFKGPLDQAQIQRISDHDVEFLYRDRRDQRLRKMRLSGQEFLRRFLQHVWPSRIHKVQYHGLWSRKSRHVLLELKQRLAPLHEHIAGSGSPATEPTPAATPHWKTCPYCNGIRHLILRFKPGQQPPLTRSLNDSETPNTALPP